uniref:FERM, ARHGEF and pleckstrin domain-containing protein 1 n=1 Tax=Gadus morhua TaxID=8049 RepID=A0A8C5A9Y8_GADMO
MVEPSDRPASAAQRLGAPDSYGVSTLEPSLRPPTTQPSGGRQVPLRVQLLDDTQEVFQISQRSPGKLLFDLVANHLNLVEGDYFGLEYQDHRKMTVSQRDGPKNTILRFVVKFFPPDHTQLMEELTRYLFALQIKHDLACGRLICNDTSAALMVSHIIQSEIGDFDETQSWQHLLHNKYLPDQDALRDKITDCHRKHVGQTPAESDYQLLEIARRLEMFGIRQHPAKDREGTKLSLAVAHTGVLVFQGYTRINAFNWSKIRKLSFKRKRFLIKLRSDPAQSNHHDTLEFSMASRDCCKVFWKVCVEHHAFFRLFEEPKPKPKPVLFTRGSSFRFSGRTQKQIIDYVKDSEFKKIPFESPYQRSSLSIHHLRCSAWFEIQSSVCCSSPLLPPDGPGSPDLPTTTPSPKPPVSPDDGVVTGQTALTVAAAGVVPPVVPLTTELCVSTSPVDPLPSPLTSPLLMEAGYVRTDDEDEARRKKFPTDKAYFLAKELLTTERTYLKDLHVVTTSFQEAVGKEEVLPENVRNLLAANYEPLLKFHQGFLREVEQRLAQWEGRSNAHIKGDYQRVGDILLKNIQGLKQLTVQLQKHPECLVELERACRSSCRLEAVCGDFELQKACYLPLNVFLLRPLHRLLHYKLLLERLCKHYPPTHQDFRDSRAALADISEMVLQLQGTMMKMENFQKLLELRKDLTGIDNLAIPGRVRRREGEGETVMFVQQEFIRLGCLSKLSGKGLQQRMFFLFSDCLVYTSRGMTKANQFKVHGQLPLYGMTVRESEDEWGVPHSFTLFGQRQPVVVAASSAAEMERWLEDIRMAVDLAEQTSDPQSDLLSSSLADKLQDEGIGEQESEEELAGSHSSLERPGHRGNTTVHVCWHRNTSVSMVDFSSPLYGANLSLWNATYLTYLLIFSLSLFDFKNSNGWQKLWVVFTSFSLFFYKSHLDDYPLASLPLLGYSVTVPAEAENIHKDYVFKLHFKSHVYYFRSESEYAFERWMEVIRSATYSASRTLTASRKDLY